MADNLGTDVSRVLDPTDKSWDYVVWQAGKPPLDSELNLMGHGASERTALHLRRARHSGILNARMASQERVFIPTLDWPGMNDNPNEFLLQNFSALVNGWVVDVESCLVNGGSIVSDNYNCIQLNSPSGVFSRLDLVFLEVWRSLVAPSPSAEYKPSSSTVYYKGNTQYAHDHPADEIIWPVANFPTTLRVQIQFRIRVISNVDFGNFPEGVDDTGAVKAMGGEGVVTGYGFSNMGSVFGDYGLYRAGDGDASSQAALGTVDGYSYAIPLVKVFRRNSSAYNTFTNRNGAGVSIVDYAATPVSTPSDRPDGKFYDEISEYDVVLLSHDVCDIDYQHVLEESFELLCSGQLSTELAQDDKSDEFGAGRLMRVDGIAVMPPDLDNVEDIGDPDGVRRVFSNRAATQAVADSFKENVSYTGANIAYDDATKLLSIEDPATPVGATIDVGTVEAKWSGGANDGLDVAFDPALAKVGSTISGTIDVTDGDYVAGGTINLSFVVEYPNAEGLSFVPTEMLDVVEISASPEEHWGFCQEPLGPPAVGDVIRNQRDFPEAETVNGYIDEMWDFAVYNMDDEQGFSRLVFKHYQGSGTAYNIPSTITINGMTHSVIGIYQIIDLNVSPNVTLDPLSFQKSVATGGFTVTLGSSYLSSQTLLFKLIVTVKSLSWERPSASILETARTRLIEKSGTLTQDEIDDGFFVIDLDGEGSLFLSMGVWKDFNGDENLFVYRKVSGGTYFTRVDAITAVSGFGTSALKVEFNPALPPFTEHDTIQVVVVASHALQITDQLLLYYLYIPYYGTGEDFGDAVIVATGSQAIMHTRGTGSNFALFGDYTKLCLSTNLPMGYDWDGVPLGDHVLTNDDVVLEYPHLYNNQELLYLPPLQAPSGSSSTQGRTPRDGLELETVTSGSYTPVRGMTGLWIRVKNSSNAYLKVLSPSKTAGDYFTQAVWYALIKLLPSQELRLLVTTATFQDEAEWVGTGSGSSAGYDVFHVKGRPLIRTARD